MLNQARLLEIAQYASEKPQRSEKPERKEPQRGGESGKETHKKLPLNCLPAAARKPMLALFVSPLNPHLLPASLADDAESLATTSVPCCAAAGSVAGAPKAEPDTTRKRRRRRRAPTEEEAKIDRSFLRCCRLRPLGGLCPPPSPSIIVVGSCVAN